VSFALRSSIGGLTEINSASHERDPSESTYPQEHRHEWDLRQGQEPRAGSHRLLPPGRV